MAVNILLRRSDVRNKRPDGALMSFGEVDLNYDSITGGLYYKNTDGSVVKVGPCQVSSTAPNQVPAGSPGNSSGEFWYDTATSTLKIFDGSNWIAAGGGGGGTVLSVTGLDPITVDNTDPANPVVSASAASTVAAGVVQLNDSVTSKSTTEAGTANAVKTAYDAGIQGQTDAAAAQITADAAIPQAAFTAAGDLLVGNGVGTYAALASGAAGYVLSTDGAGTLVWVPNTAGSVVTVSGTSPITVDNTDPQNPVVAIDASSLTTAGAVQLNDSVSSTSVTEAATPNAVKTAYDLANSVYNGSFSPTARPQSTVLQTTSPSTPTQVAVTVDLMSGLLYSTTTLDSGSF